jgi:hypothetical protein
MKGVQLLRAALRMILNTLITDAASGKSIVADPRRSLKHLSKRFNLQNHYIAPFYHHPVSTL